MRKQQECKQSNTVVVKQEGVGLFQNIFGYALERFRVNNSYKQNFYAIKKGPRAWTGKSAFLLYSICYAWMVHDDYYKAVDKQAHQACSVIAR